MSRSYPTIRAAAVQAASVFLDLDATVDKACALIREAGANGARVVAFPECFIPAYPIWFQFHPDIGSVATRLNVELFKNSVEVPGPEIALLQRAAADAKAYVVLGICEKVAGTNGTMYNSQVVLGPDGGIVGTRRKIMPTIGERLVHAWGRGDSMKTFDTDFGPMSALICGENSNPLAIFAMAAQYSLVHVMSWPNRLPTVAGSVLNDRVSVGAQAFAQMTKTYVIAACGVMDESTIAKLELTAADEAIVRDPGFSGGSVIVAPDSRVIAGPLGATEELLYADLDLELGIELKIRQDFAGHYNRPDIFQVHINTGAAPIYQVTGETPTVVEFGHGPGQKPEQIGVSPVELS